MLFTNCTDVPVDLFAACVAREWFTAFDVFNIMAKMYLHWQYMFLLVSSKYY